MFGLETIAFDQAPREPVPEEEVIEGQVLTRSQESTVPPIEYVGFSEAQRVWIENAIGAIGIPLGNVRQVVYVEPGESVPITAIASYDNDGHVLTIFPACFRGGLSTVHEKRSVINTITHELAHSVDPIYNANEDLNFPTEKVIEARIELFNLLLLVEQQSRISGKFIGGPLGYHQSLSDTLDQLINLNLAGKATAQEVRTAAITLQIELFAIATEFSLLMHGQLTALEKEQKKFFDNPDNESQIYNPNTGEKMIFVPFMHEMDTLLATILGFGSINKLKEQRRLLSDFTERAPALAFEPPQPAKIEN